MVDTMTLNYLFFLGILIPTIITVTLFIVFLVCWYKYRIRQQVMYKRHDPHGKYKDSEEYATRTPPVPPSTISSGSINNNNNNIKKPKSDNYEESPEPTEGFDNPPMYRTAPDSGFSDLNEIQTKLQQDSGRDRPNSQASTDSEDSGFRSSRSGQYIHSASSSSAQENVNSAPCSGTTADGLPLFKPIKLHPSEMGHVLSTHRNSGKHKRHKGTRSPLTPSHVCNTEMLPIQLQQQHRHHRDAGHLKMPVPQTAPNMPVPLRMTTAMIHKPFMEESSLYSIV